MSRYRLNIFVEPSHAKRVAELALRMGVSKSKIVAAALASFVSAEGADRREAAIAKRLDQLTQQFDRLDRDQTILIETLALYVRYYLSVSTPVPESHQEAVRAQGRARFEQFIAQLGRQLQRRRSFAREVYEDLQSDPTRNEHAPTADGANGAAG